MFDYMTPKSIFVALISIASVALSACSDEPQQSETASAITTQPEETSEATAKQSLPIVVEAPRDALPESVPFDNDEALEEWIQFYYQDPQPQQVVPAMLYLSEQGKLDKATDRAGLAFFFAPVLAANDSRAGAWAEEFDDLPPLHRAFFAQALTLADTDACDAAVHGMADRTEDAAFGEGLRQMLDMPRIDPLGIPIDNPGVVGMVWAEFVATGNTDCIARLASVGHHVVEREDPEMMVVAVKAMHELMLHATQHPLVLDTLKQLAREADGAQQQALHNCIDDASVYLDQQEAAQQRASEEQAAE